MEEERRRVGDGGDVAGHAPEKAGVFGKERDAEHDQRDDAQDVWFAEAAVLKNAEPGEARDDRPDHENLSGKTSCGDLLVAGQSDKAGYHGDQADRRVKDA